MCSGETDVSPLLFYLVAEGAVASHKEAAETKPSAKKEEENMKITTQRLEIHPMCQAEWRDILELFRDFSASPAVIYDFPLPTSEEKAKEQVRIWAESGFFYSVCLRGESRGDRLSVFPWGAGTGFRLSVSPPVARQGLCPGSSAGDDAGSCTRRTASAASPRSWRWRTKPRGSWRSVWALCRWGATSAYFHKEQGRVMRCGIFALELPK